MVLKGRKLNSHTLSIISQTKNIECFIRCWSFHGKCNSVNINTITGQCELLSENVGKFIEEKFENDLNWIHYGQKLEVRIFLYISGPSIKVNSKICDGVYTFRLWLFLQLLCSPSSLNNCYNIKIKIDGILLMEWI